MFDIININKLIIPKLRKRIQKNITVRTTEFRKKSEKLRFR